jgi:hypothetical protein
MAPQGSARPEQALAPIIGTMTRPPTNSPACASRPLREQHMRLPIYAVAILASASVGRRLLGERAIVQQKISASSGRVRGHKGHADRVPRTTRMENHQIRHRMGRSLRCGRSHRKRPSQFARETNNRFGDGNDHGPNQGHRRSHFGAQVCEVSWRRAWLAASSRDHRPLTALFRLYGKRCLACTSFVSATGCNRRIQSEEGDLHPHQW